MESFGWRSWLNADFRYVGSNIAINRSICKCSKTNVTPLQQSVSCISSLFFYVTERRLAHPTLRTVCCYSSMNYLVWFSVFSEYFTWLIIKKFIRNVLLSIALIFICSSNNKEFINTEYQDIFKALCIKLNKNVWLIMIKCGMYDAPLC